jgi:hypothetical protein
MRFSKVLLLLLGAGLFSANATLAAKSPVWACYWVHGRLTAGNGTPSTRIWPSGTRRLLGVVNSRHPVADDAYKPEIPSNVEKLLTAENDFTVWGRFYVCPVAPERAGWMRFVVVKKARSLVAKHG